MNRIDWLSKDAIDIVFGTDPGAISRPAAIIFALAVTAFFTRVTSRWLIFNAGRDAEYELRAILLAPPASPRHRVLPNDVGGRDHEPFDG